MNATVFEVIFEEQVMTCRDTLVKKSKEYMRNDDRLYNFKKAAQMDGTNPADALWGMWLKHLVSVSDIIEDVSKQKYPSKEILAEKITDSVNYLILLKAIMVEIMSDILPYK